MKLIIKDKYNQNPDQFSTVEVFTSELLCVGGGCDGQTLGPVSLDGKRPQSSSVTQLFGYGCHRNKLFRDHANFMSKGMEEL